MANDASTRLPSVCPLDCPDTCGLLVRVEEGKAVAVSGDPEHPFTRGYLCRKMGHYPQRVHSPARLTAPLVRSGAKGGGQFRPASWDEALDLVEANLRRVMEQDGPQAVLPYAYAGHMGLIHRHAGHAFFHKLGASRLLWTICGATAGVGFAATLGSGPSTDIESAVDADLIILWGCNALTTNLHAWPFFQAARQKGGRIVVIDPYANPTAQRADQHVMLKPGTDAALALGMMHVLASEDLLDHDFLAHRTTGWPQLQARLAEWPPERAASVCGIAPEKIGDLARAYGQARAPYIRTGFGLARQRRGAMAMRTIACLPALKGAFKKPGGGITRTTSEAAPFSLSTLTRPDLCPPGTRAVNMVQLGQALTQAQPPIKFLHVYLSNPAVVAPDSSAVLAGLARDDLFTVVHEMFMSETARWADVILPGASSLEVTDLYRCYGHFYVQKAKPVIDRVGESRSILEVFQELAARMGFTDDIFSLDEEAIITRLLETDSPYLAGITPGLLDDCRPHRVNCGPNPYAQGFATPSGRVELFSQGFAQAGLDPLPDGAPSQDEEGVGRYPLALITPPRATFLNSTFNEVPELLAQAGPAPLLIHPDDAEARGIAHGDEVRVFNDRGWCVLTAQVSDQTQPGLVVAEGLYWPQHTPGGHGINHLTSQALADTGGSCAFHTNLVEVGGVPPLP